MSRKPPRWPKKYSDDENGWVGQVINQTIACVFGALGIYIFYYVATILIGPYLSIFGKASIKYVAVLGYVVLICYYLSRVWLIYRQRRRGDEDHH
jgi:hypothetical protein